MTTMHNPPHPGETLREDVLPALGLTVTEAAAQLGVTRAALSRVLNGRAAISPEMALRLEGWLGVEKRRPGRWMARAASRVRPLESAHGRHACGEAGTGSLLDRVRLTEFYRRLTVQAKRAESEPLTQHLASVGARPRIPRSLRLYRRECPPRCCQSLSTGRRPPHWSD